MTKYVLIVQLEIPQIPTIYSAHLPKSTNYSDPKGQLITKGLFGILNSSKKQTKTIQPEVS